MANLITHGMRHDLPQLSMNNGLTAVVVEVLALALSAHAASDQQKRIAAWIASHDQDIVGSGCAGFRICDLPWVPSTFASDKQFVLAAIHDAAARRDWHKLGYSPREDWVLESLQTLQLLVGHFMEKHILPAALWRWQCGAEPANLTSCATHGVYLHDAGCVLCNGG